MLSRLADHLFWMSRYMERAENTARMLDVQYQAGLMPHRPGSNLDHWRALLALYELEQAFDARGKPPSPDSILGFMLVDRDNAASIWSCLHWARENARAVRVLIPPDLWESLNGSYLEMKSRLSGNAWRRDPGHTLDWVKQQSHLFRGVLMGTMLQEEAYHFCRIGAALERADNTARILDVNLLARQRQLDGLLLKSDDSASSSDFYFWSAVLRSVSAFEIYRQVTRDVVTPLQVAQLLIQRPDMPRSLFACLQEIHDHLKPVASGANSPSVRMAGKLRSQLEYLVVDADFEPQLHHFLTGLLRDVYQLGATVNEEFLTPISRHALELG